MTKMAIIKCKNCGDYFKTRSTSKITTCKKCRNMERLLKAVKAMETAWTKTTDLGIWSGPHSASIYNTETGQIIYELSGILADGGDPNIIEVDGESYLEHIYNDYQASIDSELIPVSPELDHGNGNPEFKCIVCGDLFDVMFESAEPSVCEECFERML